MNVTLTTLCANDDEWNNSQGLVLPQRKKGGQPTIKRIFLHVFSISIFSALGLLWFPRDACGGGTVVAWGGNNHGQLNPCAEDVVAIATGYEQSVLLKSDGTVANCGVHFEFSVDISYYPITVPAGLNNVVAVAGGFAHSLALKADGTVVAWGLNTYGQTNVPQDLTNVVAISAYAGRSLALKVDGTVAAWGNSSGYHTNVPAGLTNVVAIAAGSVDLALKADGTVAWWGSYFDLTDALGGLTNIVAISSGWSNFGDGWLALTADGTVLGGPNNLTNIVAIGASSGTDHHISLAVKADGTVIGWGYNFYGGPMVPPGLTNVIAVSGDSGHNLALVGAGPPELRALVANPTWESNRFNVSVSTQSGKVYRLEYKNALEETNWTVLPLVAGNGGVRSLDDPTATGTQRFYRVRHW